MWGRCHGRIEIHFEIASNNTNETQPYLQFRDLMTNTALDTIAGYNSS